MLVDELSRDMEIGRRVEIKFHMLSDAKIMVFTSVFRAKQRKSYTIFTASLVLDISLFQRFTALNTIIRDRMISLSKYLRGLCSKKDTQQALLDFDKRLRDFVATFDALNKTSYCDSIDDTFFRAAPETHQERDFLARVLTSHLQTHGHTVVIGVDISEVNRWVDTLSMFLMPSERQLCKRASHDSTQTFISELCVQGLLIENPLSMSPSPLNLHAAYHTGTSMSPLSLATTKRSNSSYSLTSTSGLSSSVTSSHSYSMMNSPQPASRRARRDQWKKLVPIHSLLSGRFPITVVDLQQRQVLHFKLYNYFVVLKKDYKESEIGNSLRRRLSRADHVWDHQHVFD